MEKLLWRVSDGKYRTDFIRADNLDEAKKIFDNTYSEKSVEFQVMDKPIFAVYFSDGCNPAFFKGTKAEATKSAKLYIRQWQLDATIERIEAR